MQTTRHRVVVPQLPPALNGLRVAQLSDFHRSRLTSDAVIREAIARVCREMPDLIVLTGDFVNDDPADIAPCMEMLAPLMQPGIAPLGVYAVPGNHDVKAGLEQIRQALESLGIVYLCNRSHRLANGLWLVGLDEDWYGTPDVNAAFADVPPDAPVLVLAHNPGEADLCGRPRVRRVFRPHARRASAGSYPHRPRPEVDQSQTLPRRLVSTGKARLYVNRGIGNADVPFRFLCPPEVAFFTLHSA